ncbi:Peptidyl-prolyl cis-trans isomerase PpiD [hydrothermal vent metagenome]|uniref:Periplasmic chaperone PpiD n=1 Tax=hydrothermal vent metagenome TaxID=652676 RepID=A0A1W1C746_9ZZZZ
MISWMQKHNKYLVWTIWVATIAFIGAGFVGWGSYNLGSKAGNVAKIGDIEISQKKLNMAYSSLYNQYNARMQGKLDEAKAKEMGLIQQAFYRVATQAKILNFAKDAGIIISDTELVEKLKSISGFQKDGIFNKEIYHRYLASQGLKAKTFEASLKEELLIQKTMKLLSIKALPFETDVVSAAMNVSDKLAYKVLSQEDVKIVPNEAKIKSFWETQKEHFMTQKSYSLSIVWTESKDVTVTEDEIKSFYDANSFNYTNSKGKQLNFKEAKDQAKKDLKLKKSKKTAQRAYIAFKKGKLKQSETTILAMNDIKLTPEIWNLLKDAKAGEILKPKTVANRYATIKVEKILPPKVKSYEEAKEAVTKLYMQQARKEAFQKWAKEELKTFNVATATLSDFVKLEENVKLNPLNKEESLQFLQKLFTSSKEKGMISIRDKVVVYKILEQKLGSADKNQTKSVNQTVNVIKQNIFESNLIQILDKKYPTETYVGGLTN